MKKLSGAVFIPKYLKNILRLQGYDNPVSIQNLGVDDFPKLESFVRSQKYAELIPANAIKSDYYGECYEHGPHLFELSGGEAAILETIIQAGKSMPLDNCVQQESLKRKISRDLDDSPSKSSIIQNPTQTHSGKASPYYEDPQTTFFWRQIEIRFIGIIPRFIKNILWLQGFDNPISIKYLKVDHIAEIESFVRSPVYSTLIPVNATLVEYYGPVYQHRPNEFKFFGGYTLTLELIVKIVGSMALEDFVLQKKSKRKRSSDSMRL
ncbi:hypothetical protein QAD02_004486 [Eretmocerus hayati]|uniref:Uncharacterized protein n=1 Tax=Eretmocerus hayati TaxID=131215 RepID=A0ACC2NPM7_9HYME|nr:hypothetical protein QAD02_004486 [Eretmocerus hayati]